MQVKMSNFEHENEKVEAYKLTRGKTISAVDMVGETFSVDRWMLYDDVNGKGEDVEVLAIKCSDGRCISTISKTFKDEFFYLSDIGLTGEPLTVITGTSKAGREYVSVTLA